MTTKNNEKPKAKDVIKKITEVEAFLNNDKLHVNGPVRSSVGHEAKVRAKKLEIEQLKKDYVALIVAKMGAVVPTGSESDIDAFVAKVKEEMGDVAMVTYGEVYDRVAKNVYAGMPRKADVTPAAFASIITELNFFLKETMEFANAPILKYRAGVAVNSVEQLRSYVQSRVEEVADTSLAVSDVHRQAGKEALRLRYEGNVLPVVVRGALQEEDRAGVLEAFDNRAVFFDVNTIKEVGEPFSKLKSFYPKQKNNKENKEKNNE